MKKVHYILFAVVAIMVMILLFTTINDNHLSTVTKVQEITNPTKGIALEYKIKKTTGSNKKTQIELLFLNYVPSQ